MVSINNGVALLNWSTANEINNKGFQVDREVLMAVNFIDIGFVNGKGNISNVSNYQFTDAKVLSGNNFYRLKQIDNDGQFVYSSVIKLDYSIVRLVHRR